MKVLVIDDSALFRRGICSVIEQMSEFQLLGSAPNGKVGLQLAESKKPDVVIVDLEMPIMDGISFIQEYRKVSPKTKILVFSSHTRSGAKMTIDALLAGANDFLSKTDVGQGEGDPVANMKAVLAPKLKQFLPKKINEKVAEVKSVRSAPLIRVSPKVIAIGSSTGGPEALRVLMNALPNTFNVPVLIAQHMPAMFTAELARMLNKQSPWEIKEAEEGEIALPGKCYIAPGDFHMRVKGERNRLQLVMDQGPKVNYVRPAVDLLFESLADVCEESVLSIILTGMGEDGMRGVQALKKFGGPVIIQDEASSVVWGMPGAVYKTGLYDEIQPISKIAGAVSTYFNSATTTMRRAAL